jgi:hypothetical protein
MCERKLGMKNSTLPHVYVMLYINAFHITFKTADNKLNSFRAIIIYLIEIFQFYENKYYFKFIWQYRYDISYLHRYNTTYLISISIYVFKLCIWVSKLEIDLWTTTWLKPTRSYWHEFFPLRRNFWTQDLTSYLGRNLFVGKLNPGLLIFLCIILFVPDQ